MCVYVKYKPQMKKVSDIFCLCCDVYLGWKYEELGCGV